MKKYYVRDGNVAHSDAGMEDDCGVMYDPNEVEARVAKLEHELEIRKAAVEAQHDLIKQVRTLTRSNARLRAKIDRLSRSL